MSFRPTRPVCIRARSCEVSRVRNVPPAARFNESTDAHPLQCASVVPRVSCESDAREQPRWSAPCVSRLAKPPIPELHNLPPEDPRIQRGIYLRAMKHSLVLLFVTLSLRAQARHRSHRTRNRPPRAVKHWPTSRMLRGRNYSPSPRPKTRESNPHRRSSNPAPGSREALMRATDGSVAWAGISRPIAAPSTWVRDRSSLEPISC